MGCIASQQQYSQQMESWKGKTIDELISSEWGYPDESLIAPNGNRLYKYIDRGQSVETQHVFNWRKNVWVPQPYVINNECITFFEVDNNNRVVNVRWKGDSCL